MIANADVIVPPVRRGVWDGRANISSGPRGRYLFIVIDIVEDGIFIRVRSWCVWLLLSGAGVCAVATPSWAQSTVRVEASGGYNLLKLPGDTLPVGWYADAAVYAGATLSVVGQINGNYKTAEVAGITGARVGRHYHGFMGGVRASHRTSPKVELFGQALLGGVHSAITVICSDCTETDEALQLGGGTNLMSGRIGVRISVDYIRMFLPDASVNAMRVAAGAVYGFRPR
jgi:hypothetical protein